MSDEFFRRSLVELNPKATVKRYNDEYSADAFFLAIDKLPKAKRVEKVMELYRDLALGRKTPAIAQAGRYGVQYYDLESRITGLGADAVGHLLDFIEEFGCSKPVCEEEAIDLTTSAAFLLGDMKLQERDICRLQEILAKRVALDRQIPRTSTLAENIARVLHELRPRRFPDSKLNPRTSHLDNPDPFLP